MLCVCLSVSDVKKTVKLKTMTKTKTNPCKIKTKTAQKRSSWI